MSSISKKLTIAVLLSCASYIPQPTLAEEPAHTPNLWETKTIDKEGKEHSFLTFDVYNKTNDPEGLDEEHPYRDFLPKEKETILDGLQYISDMVGFPASGTSPVVKLELMETADDNAFAESQTAFHEDSNISGTQLAEWIQSEHPPTIPEDGYVAEITIDNPYDHWYTDSFSNLPQNDTVPDYFSTVTHEICHALGLEANVHDQDGRLVIGTDVSYGEEEEKTASILNTYEAGLRDVFGRVTYYGDDGTDTPIYFDDNPEEVYSFAGVLQSRTMTPITYEEYQELVRDPSQRDDNAFYILKDEADQEAVIGTKGGAYFTGQHIKEVLTTKGEEALIAWPNQGVAPAIKGGIPVNGFESENLDLSHIELQNSSLSHQRYRNWCTLMEAEIAMLQDLGYTIDRSQYFGKSIYNSGTLEDDGQISYFTYENQKGFQSKQRHGIGLHLYGRYIDVAQKGNIAADGAYGMGIRVDGVGNQIAIASQVSANGTGGNALAVTYGKEHTITLEKNASLVALGEQGIAARFDFGSNALGDKYNYRGSYLNCGTVTGWDDYWTDFDLLPDLEGALGSRFDVHGLLAGKEAAIYISPNAYVQNINLMDDTILSGNIISEWNPKQGKYQHQDETGKMVGNPQIPDDDPYKGRTILTFGTKADDNGQSTFHLDDQQKMMYTPDKNFSLTYDGNIKGPESLEVKALGGTLTYNGNADVYSFAIGEDGTVKGDGNYKVKQGFTNDGHFQLSQKVKETTIDGSYTQSNTGTLMVGFNGKGHTDTLRITGNATIDGTLSLSPTASYYSGNRKITPNQVLSATQGMQGKFHDVQLVNSIMSPTLHFAITDNQDGTYTLSASRASNAYSRLATDSLTRDIATAFDKNASSVQGNAQDLVAAIDFAGSAADVNTALGKLNPSLYGSEGQSQLQSHALLDNLTPLGRFSSSHASEYWTASENQVDSHNSHVIAMPFSSYTNQHRDGQGYKTHQTGFLGSVEHTRSNGLTLGWHGAVSHQSISDTSGSVKGNAFYVGTQANYAPDNWHGWSLFGSARLGVEQMKSRRHVTIGSYTGNSHADWTGFSGDFRLGGALTKETPSIQHGPFASLSYRFAHRPSVTEQGDAMATHLDSTTYDSLSTQLGYELSTRPKALSSYEGATWQLHSSLSWNHELLSNNGHTDYSFRDLPGVTISDPTADYGRDSLNLSAGLTLRAPKSWDVTFQVGSDMYLKGGSSTYGKVNVEWRF